MKAAQRWPAFVRPQSDELLSGWLVRTAHAHGLSTQEFFRLVWPKYSIGASDPDLRLIPALLDTVNLQAGLTASQVYQMTLLPFEGKLVYPLFPRFTPYILPLAWGLGRTQTTGIAYCPTCIGQTTQPPYFRRWWRLAVSVVCLSCQRPLLDSCHHCGQRVVYGCQEKKGSNQYTLSRCIFCNQSLSHVTFKAAMPHQLRLQETINDQLNAQKASHSIHYFELLRYMIRLLSRKLDILRPFHTFVINHFTPTVYPGPPLGEFEQLPIALRRSLLEVATWLLSDWPYLFLEVCQYCRIRHITLYKPGLPLSVAKALQS